MPTQYPGSSVKFKRILETLTACFNRIIALGIITHTISETSSWVRHNRECWVYLCVFSLFSLLNIHLPIYRVCVRETLQFFISITSAIWWLQGFLLYNVVFLPFPLLNNFLTVLTIPTMMLKLCLKNEHGKRTYSGFYSLSSAHTSFFVVLICASFELLTAAWQKDYSTRVKLLDLVTS